MGFLLTRFHEVWLFFFFFIMIRRPPRPTLFPYPTLSRSAPAEGSRQVGPPLGLAQAHLGGRGANAGQTADQRDAQRTGELGGQPLRLVEAALALASGKIGRAHV